MERKLKEFGHVPVLGSLSLIMMLNIFLAGPQNQNSAVSAIKKVESMSFVTFILFIILDESLPSHCWITD